MSNPFESYSEIAKPVRRERQERSTAKRRNTIRSQQAVRFEAEQEEQCILLKGFHKAEREDDQRLCEGPHGKDVRGIIIFLKTMTLSSAPALVRLVQEAAWVKTMSFEDRYRLLSMISRGVVKLRKKNGLTPFDDALPFGLEEPTAFDLIKAEFAEFAEASS